MAEEQVGLQIMVIQHDQKKKKKNANRIQKGMLCLSLLS